MRGPFRLASGPQSTRGNPPAGRLGTDSTSNARSRHAESSSKHSTKTTRRDPRSLDRRRARRARARRRDRRVGRGTRRGHARTRGRIGRTGRLRLRHQQPFEPPAARRLAIPCPRVLATGSRGQHGEAGDPPDRAASGRPAGLRLSHPSRLGLGKMETQHRRQTLRSALWAAQLGQIEHAQSTQGVRSAAPA